MAIKFVTFNVENLFTRPTAMNLSNVTLGTDKLRVIADLQAELARPEYNARRIVKLANAARGYFRINKTRGRSPLSYSRKRKSYQLRVKGRADWEGFVDRSRDGFSSASVANTGNFIDQLDADIIGVCEVENLDAMRRFRSEHLSGEEFRYEILIDGTDTRGIDVGLYSRFELGALRTNIHFRLPGRSTPLFPRDCMEVEIPMAGNDSLWVLQNHFRSKLGPPGEEGLEDPADPDVLLQDDGRPPGPGGDGSEYVGAIPDTEGQECLSHGGCPGRRRAPWSSTPA